MWRTRQRILSTGKRYWALVWSEIHRTHSPPPFTFVISYMGHSSSHLLPCTICSQHCTEWSLNGNFIRWPTILSPLPPSPSTHSLKIFKFSIVKRQNLTWSMSTVALRFLQALTPLNLHSFHLSQTVVSVTGDWTSLATLFTLLLCLLYYSSFKS